MGETFVYWLCILQTILNLLISCCKHFLFWRGKFLILSIQTITVFANKDRFTSSFSLYILIHFLALAMTSSNRFNLYGDSEHPFFVSSFGANIFSFTNKDDVTCRVFGKLLSRWGSFFLFPVCWEVFNLSEFWILSIFFFFPFTEIINIFILLMWSLHWWILNVKQVLYSWVSTPLDLAILFFIYYQIDHAKILLRIFVCMFMSDTDLLFSFLSSAIFVWFG